MEFIKINDFDPRHITVGPTTPMGITTIEDHEFRCPRCASIDMIRSEIWLCRWCRHQRRRWYESWTTCDNCGWSDEIDPRARVHLDGSVCTDWPF